MHHLLPVFRQQQTFSAVLPYRRYHCFHRMSMGKSAVKSEYCQFAHLHHFSARFLTKIHIMPYNINHRRKCRLLRALIQLFQHAFLLGFRPGYDICRRNAYAASHHLIIRRLIQFLFCQLNRKWKVFGIDRRTVSIQMIASSSVRVNPTNRFGDGLANKKRTHNKNPREQVQFLLLFLPSVISAAPFFQMQAQNDRQQSPDQLSYRNRSL